jgi:hypothetical protein
MKCIRTSGGSVIQAEDFRDFLSLFMTISGYNLENAKSILVQLALFMVIVPSH